jgi:hypothetical protein
MIGRGNRITRRKPAPVPLCPPQTPHAARTRTRAAAVGSQRLTAELRHYLNSTLKDIPLYTNENITPISITSILQIHCVSYHDKLATSILYIFQTHSLTHSLTLRYSSYVAAEPEINCINSNATTRRYGTHSVIMIVIICIVYCCKVHTY